MSVRMTKNDFLHKAIEAHGDKYDYSLVDYANTKTKVDIICDTHGLFSQSPGKHMSGRGCRLCSKGGGFKVYKSAILYYLKINNGEAYKIGITNKSVKERFSNSDLKNIEILKVWEYPIGKDALMEEQKILNMYRDKRYKGTLLRSGNTELFSEDVLDLNKGGSYV